MTSTASLRITPPVAAQRLPYGPLISLMLLAFLLVTAEFLPNGVLTEMAVSLGVTPGQAGQAVTATAFVGLLVAPTVGMLFPRLDRRTLFLGAAAAAGLSSIVAAIAPTLVLLLLSRMLLGAAISAFWSMSITVAAAVVGTDRVGRAVMFTSAGMSLATVAGVPLGVLLSELVDWRAVFAGIGVLSALMIAPLRVLLPRVAPAPASGFRVLWAALVRPGVGLALSGHALVVLGHFLAYTYIRLALERVPGVDAGTLVLLLSLFGAGGLVGNIVVGLVIDRAFAVLGVVAPTAIAVAIGTMLLAPGSLIAIGAAVIVWGFFFASWLIIVNAWVGHRMPDRLEAGGSLVVVGFQFSIVLAAGFGGVLVDTVGVAANDALAVVLLLAGAALFGAASFGRNGIVRS